MISKSSPTTRTHTAFISYSRKDAGKLALKLRKMVEKEGSSVWQDVTDMEGGRDWWLQITQAIDHVEYLVLLLTEEALRSSIMRKEWRYARQQGVCILPVVIDAKIDINSLPRWIQHIGILDLRISEQTTKFLSSLKSPCKQVRVPFMVDDLPENFVKRPKEFDELVSCLLEEDSEDPVAITAALKGAGGYGKTLLARALCHDERIQDAYDDGILWVTLGENPGNPTGPVLDLIETLSGERPGFTSIEPAATRFKELLADRDILLVVDDVWNAADLRPFLQGGTRCARLVTTRDAGTLPANTKRVNVDAMKDKEALHLLGSGLPRGSEGELQELARLLGEWALLLSMVNGVLRERVNNCGQVLSDALRDARTGLERHGITHFDARDAKAREQAVSRTIGVSLDLLRDDERSRFVELAMFPEDLSIPLDAVMRLWKQSAGLDEFGTQSLCERLFRLSLVQGFELSTRSLRIHDVIRKYLLSVSTNEQLRASHEQLLEAYHSVCGSLDWVDGPNDGYYFQHILWHMQQVGRTQEIEKLLWNPRWHRAKLKNAGAYALIEDFGMVPQDRELHLIRDAFDLSASVLMRDRTQYSSQLIGRLLSFKEPRIVSFVETIANTEVGPWLRPLTATLARPGGYLIRTIEGHSGKVRAVALTDDGKAVSASDDTTLKVWDIASGKLLHALEGHSGPIRDVALTDDGKTVSASSDGTLKVWDIATGKLLRTLEGHVACVNAVVLTSDGKAISASDDATLKVWDIASGKLLRTLQGHIACVKAVALTGDGKAVSASAYKKLRVWDIASGKLLHTLMGHSEGINAVALTGDGKAVSASDDKTLKVWDIASGKLLHTLEGHSKVVHAVALTDDGKAVSASGDATLKVWDIASGKLLHTLEGHSAWVWAVALTDDGKAISASGDTTLKVWDVASGMLLHTLEGHSDWVSAVAVTRDGKAVSASPDTTLKVWDIASRNDPHTPGEHSDRINALALTDDGKVVSASADSTLKVWDIASGQLLHTLEGHSAWVWAVALTDNGKAVSASGDKTLKVWDIDSGNILHTLEGHSDRVVAVAVTDDGKVVSASDDKTLKVWDIASGKLLHTLKGHSEVVTAVALTGDGKAVSASDDKKLKVWDIASGRLLHTLKGHSKSVRIVALTDDGKAVSASWDSTLKVWDIASGRLLHTIEGHPEGGVTAVALTGDGMAISASWDSTLKVWDIASGKLLHTLEGHSKKVRAVGVTEDGRAVSASDDKTLKVWDIAAGRLQVSFAGDYADSVCAIDWKRRAVAVGDVGGHVHFLRLEGV
jgi:WD40 repeat protein